MTATKEEQDAILAALDRLPIGRPLTPKELARVEEAKAAIARGERGSTSEEVMAEARRRFESGIAPATPKMREAAEVLLALHRGGLWLIPKVDSLRSACLAWARRGALEKVADMQDEGTGLRGMAFRLKAEWVDRFEVIERDQIAERAAG